MPSETHENFVLLFRNHPELAIELASQAGVRLVHGYQRLEEIAAEFEDPLRPGNPVRADHAIVGIVAGRRRWALAIEIQLEVDLNKQWTTVLYRAGLRRRAHCPAWTLVVSPEPSVRAAFAERMFRDEPELRPLVVTPDMIPVVRDLETAIANPAWAVLAACMHPDGPDAVIGATVAIQALLHVAPEPKRSGGQNSNGPQGARTGRARNDRARIEDYGRYIQLVAASVGEDVMHQVREQLPPDDQDELTEWERRGSSFTRGHAEGLEQGLEQGLAQGLQGMRAALRSVLEARGLPLDEQTEARIASCSEIEALRQLIARAATIMTTSELLVPATQPPD